MCSQLASSAAVEEETASQEQEVCCGHLFGHLRRRLDETSDEHIRTLNCRFKKVANWLPPADDTIKDIPKSVSSALWSFLAVFLWVAFGLREVDTINMILDGLTNQESFVHQLLGREKFHGRILSWVRDHNLPPKLGFLAFRAAGMSVHQYTAFRHHLECLVGFTVLPCARLVSEASASFFKKAIDDAGIVQLPLKRCVYRPVLPVIEKLSTWMKEHYQGISFRDCNICIRIDGRPFRSFFDVLVGLSLISQGTELCFGLDQYLVPILIYRGAETLVDLASCVVGTIGQDLEKLEDKFLSHHFTSDGKLFWNVADLPIGHCAYCACSKPEHRLDCKCEGGLQVQMGQDALFKSWLRNFVICSLHMLLRFGNHFARHLTAQAYACKSRFRALLACTVKNNIKYKVYTDKNSKTNWRVCSYTGAQAKRLFAFVEELSEAAVPPVSSLFQPWKSWADVERWAMQHGSTFMRFLPRGYLVLTDDGVLRGLDCNSVEKAYGLAVTAAREAHAAEDRPDIPDDPANAYLPFYVAKIWREMSELWHILHHGLDSSKEREPQLQSFGKRCETVLHLWRLFKLKENVRWYEHLLLSHGAALLKEYPHGLSAFSQTSHERANGTQTKALRQQCFQGGSYNKKGVRVAKGPAGGGSNIRQLSALENQQIEGVTAWRVGDNVEVVKDMTNGEMENVARSLAQLELSEAIYEEVVTREKKMFAENGDVVRGKVVQKRSHKETLGKRSRQARTILKPKPPRAKENYKSPWKRHTRAASK